MLVGVDWQKAAAAQLPGSSAQMRHNVATFFDADLPALLGWDFRPDQASRIGCPLLYVGGPTVGHGSPRFVS